LTILIVEGKSKEENTPKITDFKGFWINNRLVFTGVTAFFASGFGYLCNSLFLSRLFSYANWNTMNFNKFGDTTISDIIYGLINMFGFVDSVAVITPGGVINIFVYIAIIIFIFYMTLSLMKGLSKSSRIILLFFSVSILFNIYLYIHIDYITRYFYPLLLVIFPCFAIIIEKSKISDIRKWTFGVIWAGLLFTSSLATLSSEINTDENNERYAAAKFLSDSDYHFGYATFGNASIFTFLTNGKVEVGNLKKSDAKGNKTVLAFEYEWDRWLTPKRYYESDYPGEKIFLLIQNKQYDYTPDLKIFKSGKQVFHDDNYTIFEYESHQAFKEGF
ncbi:MAG: hypothetical protein K5873_01335, partial [Treponema sp.]|nr:hypothetical protein [Treponema sp.]